MGYNTAVLICNDHLHDIKRDPNFGARLADAIQTATSMGDSRVAEGGHGFGGVYVLPGKHADDCQLIHVGRNCINRVTGYSPTHDPEVVMRALAHQLGYRVSKKPEPKPLRLSSSDYSE